MRFFISTLFLSIFFISCSSNNVFQPDYVNGVRKLKDGYDHKLFAQHKNGITYENGAILRQEGLFINFSLPKYFAYLNENEEFIIAADNSGKILVKPKKEGKEYLLTTNEAILSASIEGDLLAVVNIKNEMKIFSLKNEKEIYSFAGLAITSIDIRLASPLFYESLIFFPTLDGKIQIYSKALKKMVRTMSVSIEDQFNNIIFFKIINKKIIAATGTKIYLFNKKAFNKDIAVREIFLSDDNIIVLSKDGRIISLDLDLNIKYELKYKFAHFLGGLSTNEAIYVVESEGYLLKLKKDFSLSLLYNLEFENDFFFVGKKHFYFSSGYYTP